MRLIRFKNTVGTFIRQVPEGCSSKGPVICTLKVSYAVGRLDGEEVIIADRCVYFCSCLTKNGCKVLEMSSRISNSGAVYAGLKHLWSLPVISLKLKGHIYCLAIHSALFGREMLSLRAENFCTLGVFDITWSRYSERMRNAKFKNRVHGAISKNILPQCSQTSLVESGVA